MIKYVLPALYLALFLSSLVPEALSQTANPSSGRMPQPEFLATGSLEKVVYAFDRKFSPFSFVRNQKPVGFEVEILEALFDKSGFKIEYRPSRDWTRTQAELASGEVHLASGMTRTELRQKLFIYPNTPTLSLGLKFFVNRADGMRIIEDLRGTTVATVRDSLYQRLLQEFGGIKIKLYDTEEKALEALVQDKVDAAFGADLMTYFIMERERYANIVVLGPMLTSTPVYFALYKGKPELRDFIDRGIKTLLRNGTYDRIYRKWFVPRMSPPQINSFVTQAKKALQEAYAPDGGPVRSAAVLTREGRVYTGASIAYNDSGIAYEPLEIALIKAVNDGNMEVRAAVVLSDTGDILPPSPRERTFLAEFGRGTLVLLEDAAGKPTTWLLPRLLPFTTTPMPPPSAADDGMMP